jgi:hypothetical protein
MIFSAPRGIARVFFVLGYLVAGLGVAIFFYALLSTMSESMQPTNAGQYGLLTPDPSRLFRLVPIAFALALPGILVANLAALLGRHDKLWGDINSTRIDRVVGGINTGSGHLNMSGSSFQDIDQSWRQFNVDAARYEIRNLRAEVLRLGISQRDLQPILNNLDEAETELQHRQPNASRVAGFLREATNLLEGAGALAGAGQTLLPRLMELSKLLGFS